MILLSNVASVSQLILLVSFSSNHIYNLDTFLLIVFTANVNDILSPIRGKNIHCRARFDFFELEIQRYAVIRGLLSRTRHAFPTIG